MWFYFTHFDFCFEIWASTLLLENGHTEVLLVPDLQDSDEEAEHEAIEELVDAINDADDE